MANLKNSFIQSFFSFLQDKEYILLKWWGQDLNCLPVQSDLDILVRPHQLPQIEAFLKTTKGIKGYQQQEHIGVHHYFLYFEDGQFLQIDFLTQFIRKNLSLIHI